MSEIVCSNCENGILLKTCHGILKPLAEHQAEHRALLTELVTGDPVFVGFRHPESGHYSTGLTYFQSFDAKTDTATFDGLTLRVDGDLVHVARSKGGCSA